MSAIGKILRHKGFDISTIADFLPAIYKDAILFASAQYKIVDKEVKIAVSEKITTFAPLIRIVKV